MTKAPHPNTFKTSKGKRLEQFGRNTPHVFQIVLIISIGLKSISTSGPRGSERRRPRVTAERSSQSFRIGGFQFGGNLVLEYLH